MLWLLALVAALVLVVPGVEFLRWFVVDCLHLYDELSLTDGCLVILVVLQVAILVHLAAWRRTTESEPEPERRARRARVAPSLNSEEERTGRASDRSSHSGSRSQGGSRRSSGETGRRPSAPRRPK